MIERISQPIDLGDGNCAHVSASIGIAIPTGPGETADAVLRRADAAMYEAKQNGRSQARFSTCPSVPVLGSAVGNGPDSAVAPMADHARRNELITRSQMAEEPGFEATARNGRAQ